MPNINHFTTFIKRKRLAGSLTSVIILTSFLSNIVQAQGNLMIMPKRMVFEGSKRSDELNLANTGIDTATYVISFVQMRMTEAGGFEKIMEPDSAQFFSDKNIRFFPRSVTLAPNEAQSIKIQVTKSGDLKPGEYRSHLYFRALPKERPLGEPEPKQDSSISVSLVPVFGISIPVIIRVGANDAKVSLTDVALKTEQDSIPALKMTFHRTGAMSVYGDLVVEHTSPTGQKTKVASVKGLAVYTPNLVRTSKVALQRIPGVDYHSGTLKVLYADQSSKVNKLAEEEIQLR